MVKRLPAAFYELPSGRVPVREWLKSLDKIDRKIIGEDIEDVEFSWPIGMPVCRARVPRARQGLVGSAKRTDAEPYLTRAVLHSRGPDGAFACLHREDAEDAGQRFEFGDEEEEGDRMSRKKGRIGSSFDDVLKEEGIYEEVTARAIKRVIARQLDALMEDQGLTKSELAKRMKTSRAQLDRLLDPDNESVTLGTLTRAAQAVGRHLRMELV